MRGTAPFDRSKKAKAFLDSLGASRTALEKAIELAEYGDKRAIAARNLCEKDLDDKIRTIAGYVDVEAAGDPNVVLKAGFELRKRNNQPQPMTAPQTPIIKRTDTVGEIIFRWKPVPNSKNYHVEIRPITAGGTWKTTEFTTKARCVISGLTPGKKYAIRVKAMGADGIGPPSPALEFFAA